MSTKPPPKPVRPIAITVAGWILLLGALVNIVFGALFFYASGTLSQNPNAVGIFADASANKPIAERNADLAEGGIDLFLGVVQLAITIGFWRVRQWAWVAAMSWQALKLLFEIASVLLGGGTLITILFASLLVLLLNQEQVRHAFQIQSENESSSGSLRILDSN